MKAALFVAWLGATAVTVALAGWLPALALASALTAWVALEDRRRRRFAFVDGLRESHVDFATQPHAVICSRFEPLAVFAEEHRRFSIASFSDGKVRTVIETEEAPLAADLGPGGCLALALGREIRVYGPEGGLRASRAFDPPLYRQAYQLRYSGDGRWLMLHTPWFVEVHPADLGSLGSRLRFEDAGHYLKYCDLSPDGGLLLCAGALLLDDEAGGGIEARWGLWALDGQAWVRRWARAKESAANSHLRGARLSGGLAVVEVYQDGYDIVLQDSDGRPVWERPGGEKPVTDPQGSLALWENPFEGLTLSRLPGGEKVWVQAPQARLRHKALAGDGSSLALEGRRFIVRAPNGGHRWEAWLKTDPDILAAGPGGRMGFVAGTRGGLATLPFEGA